jgi:hypothetical protein
MAKLAQSNRGKSTGKTRSGKVNRKTATPKSAIKSRKPASRQNSTGSAAKKPNPGREAPKGVAVKAKRSRPGKATVTQTEGALDKVGLR